MSFWESLIGSTPANLTASAAGKPQPYPGAASPGDALKQGVSGFYNWATGNPEGVKAAYDKAIADSRQGGEQIKNFLLGREAQAQQFYQPLQRMFTNAYGTQGIAAPQTPGVPGSTPFQSAFGGSR